MKKLSEWFKDVKLFIGGKEIKGAATEECFEFHCPNLVGEDEEPVERKPGFDPVIVAPYSASAEYLEFQHQARLMSEGERRRHLLGDWNAQPDNTPQDKVLCPHCLNLVHQNETTCSACGQGIKHESN